MFQKSNRTYILCIVLSIGLIVLIFNQNISLSASTNPTAPFLPITSYFPSTIINSADFTWTSNDHPTTHDFVNHEATGDHVVFTIEALDLPVTRTMMWLRPNLEFQYTSIIPDDPEFNPFTDVIYGHEDQFDWFTVQGRSWEFVVSLVHESSASPQLVMAWSVYQDPFTMSYSNNILGSNMAGGSLLKSTAFQSQDGAFNVGIYNLQGLSNDCRLLVYDDRWYDAVSSSETVSFDTYGAEDFYGIFYGTNFTTDVLFASMLNKLSRTTIFVPRMTFNNFFAPEVKVNPPVEIDDNIFNISWSSTDRNENDVHYYDVTLYQGGSIRAVLASNFTETSIVWDSSSYSDRIDYSVRVRAYSLDFNFNDECSVHNPPESYWPGDYTDEFSTTFTAGNDAIIPTTSAPTGTPTSPPPDSPITTPPSSTTPPHTISTQDPLRRFLIIGISFEVVVIAILIVYKKSQ